MVRSLSGHDKDQLYLILKDCGRDLLLTDGHHHPIERTKTKNKKHVQLIRRIPDEIVEWAANDIINTLSDELIRRVLECQNQM